MSDAQKNIARLSQIVGSRQGAKETDVIRAARAEARGPENGNYFSVQYINRPAFGYYRRLRRVKSYVEQNYSLPITLGDAARVACLERKYFSAFFRDKTGVCFRDWLAHVRVTRAAELMRHNNHTITNIAHAAGFGDLRTFERTFKKIKGITPRQFKKIVGPC